MVCCQKNGVLSLYDSIKDGKWIFSHVRAVYPQLKLIYDQVRCFKDLTKIKICCPQDQGTTSDCALFALANTRMLLDGENPCEFELTTHELRPTFRSIKKDAEIARFPGTKLKTIPTSEQHPWLRRLIDFAVLFPRHQITDESEKQDENEFTEEFFIQNEVFLSSEVDPLSISVEKEVSDDVCELEVTNPVEKNVDEIDNQRKQTLIEIQMQHEASLEHLKFSDIQPDTVIHKSTVCRSLSRFVATSVIW